MNQSEQNLRQLFSITQVLRLIRDMNKAKLLLKYINPYKWSAIRSVVYNILSAVFALVSYTLIIPFLHILFDRVESIAHPGSFEHLSIILIIL